MLPSANAAFHPTPTLDDVAGPSTALNLATPLWSLSNAQRVSDSLPLELWLDVFAHLTRHDMRALRCVDRGFCALVQPLLYRYAEFTRLGLRFPFTDEVLPFLSFPELGITPVSKKRKEAILSELRTIELRPHSPDDCTMFELQWGLAHAALGKKLNVVLLELTHCADHDHLDGDLPGAYFRHALGRHDYYSPNSDERHRPRHASCRAQCFYLSATLLWAARPRKLVYRNAPSMWYSPQEERLYQNFNPKECVYIMHSAILSDRGPEGRPFCNQAGAHGQFPAYGMRPTPPPGATRLTIVFWTGAPRAPHVRPYLPTPWVPDCGHLFRLATWGGCVALRRLWSDIVSLVEQGNCLEYVKLVNADSVPPSTAAAAYGDGFWPGRGREHATSLEARCNERLAETDSKRRIGCVAHTMKQWIDNGEADDVLEPDEIRRFLRQPPDNP